MRKGSRTRKEPEREPAVKEGTQKVYRLVWTVPWKAEHVLQETGEDLFRRCKPEEVVPNVEEYYFQPRFRQNHFYRQSFSHLVEWKSVVELCDAGCIWVKKDFSL